MTHCDYVVRKTLPKFSERVLTSTKILSQRSAVPAVFSRAAENSVKAGTKRKAVTHDEKTRLLKMGKRLRRGPFNAYVDPDQVGEGSAMLELSEAAKQAGTYDVWAGEVPGKVAVKVRTAPVHEVLPNVSLMHTTNAQAAQSQHPRSMIALPAVPSPHEGTSYNPPVVSHLELLRAAHEVEEQKLRGVDELEATRAKIEKARAIAAAEAAAASVEGTAPGMKVDESGEAQAEEEDAGAEPLPPKKMPGRKTKQQRKKAERLRAEVSSARFLRRSLLTLASPYV